VAGVNDRLLDCSDAHHYSSSQEKDRIGNCATWICADPTLAGLKHALWEYRARVYIGEKPPLLVHQETDPTNFISSIAIRPANPREPQQPTFDIDLPLNNGFVAVIGNKGSGKSALLDSLALAANSHSQGDFTFLSEQRFRNPRNNKAPHFTVAIQTADGERTNPIPLSSLPDRDSPERIRYLPQSLLERLCNKEPGSGDDPFEIELRSIIFSHVPEHQRLGCGSLDELLRRRGHALDQEIGQWRTKLSELNRTIGNLEDRGRGSRRRMLQSGLRAVEEQLSSHDSSRPADPVPPDEVATEAVQKVASELAEARGQLEAVSEQEALVKGDYALTRRRFDDATNLLRGLGSLRSVLNERFTDLLAAASAIGLNPHDLVRVEIDEAPVRAVVNESQQSITALNLQLAPEGQIAIRKSDLTVRITFLEEQLDEPRKQYEQQRRQVQAWFEARERLVGGPTIDGTIEFFKHELSLADAVPSRLGELSMERNLISQRIHALLLEELELYRELYEPVQQFLDGNELAKRQFSLEFEVDLEIVDFADRFLSLVDRSVTGTFYGIESSLSRVMGRVKSSIPQDWSSVSKFIAEHNADLHTDRRGTIEGEPMDSPADLLRKGVTLPELYDYLFGLSYLEAHFELRSEGRSIAELSPGQKGTILLMFYLLVDQSGRPIALDQPDENLDSHTIHKLLRPAIRAAKVKRQVFVVTHSPNLAIVGDADQVVVASCDGKQFMYRSGSIESPDIRDLVLEVLEGTWPAFADRQRKYSVTEFDRSFPELTD
jgi:ABC-type lipoprotein export system ATPase subunit